MRSGVTHGVETISPGLAGSNTQSGCSTSFTPADPPGAMAGPRGPPVRAAPATAQANAPAHRPTVSADTATGRDSARVRAQWPTTKYRQAAVGTARRTN